MVARAGGDFPVAERLHLAAHGRLAERDAEFLPDPLHQIDQPPANHPVDGRDRAALDNTRERPTLVVVQLGSVSRRLAADQPVRAAGVEAQHPITNDLKADATDLGRLRPPTPS